MPSWHGDISSSFSAFFSLSYSSLAGITAALPPLLAIRHCCWHNVFSIYHTNFVVLSFMFQLYFLFYFIFSYSLTFFLALSLSFFLGQHRCTEHVLYFPLFHRTHTVRILTHLFSFYILPSFHLIFPTPRNFFFELIP